jgi:superfamily II DNA or RNA helicase
MLALEAIKKDAQIHGLAVDQIARVVSAEMLGAGCCQCLYRLPDNSIHEALLYRSDEPRLELVEAGKQWAFDADGDAFKLGAEAYRINLAHLFDPFMAVHTADVDPLPHQITAVYEAMLPRQPLRFVLADDPGAGKTIMAGLLIRELLLRAAAKRILIVAPGSLVEQWRVELKEKFGLNFTIYSPALDQHSASGNAFEDHPQLIARLDQLSRNDDVLEKALRGNWDLVIFDEAHKLSASWNGGDVKKTRRYEMAEALGAATRHLLLMTATPHNGKEEDFQLFLGLLDSDRFFGKFRDGVHKVDTSDLMRRMVKEDLVKFDGTPLFPERRAYTAKYQLSPAETDLYDAVSSYVREGMNRLEAVKDGKRKNTVGFALTALQRRLASSPAAIYKSLKRRLDKLLKLRDEEAGLGRRSEFASDLLQDVSMRDVDYMDWEDEATAEEYEEQAETLVSGATLARTLKELDKEIAELEWLVELAQRIVVSNEDRKWDELSRLLQESPEMRLADGSRRKILIFTEHKDTLLYLKDKIGNDLLGRPDAVVTIDGSTVRERRLEIQALFNNDPEVVVLIATDAASEGVNLQKATNLMVNYDLPWNPNRLEQRFGRIHRIGQQEICHLWNLLAANTREGDVFDRLFEKLNRVREAFGGKVFDILGTVFEERSLKDMLLEAIQYGERPEVRARLFTSIEDALDTEHIKSLIARNALNQEILDQTRVLEVRHQMEMAEARKLQPYFIKAFFFEAFKALGGEWRADREEGRHELIKVPAEIRERDRVLAGRLGEAPPVLKRYDRICFEKKYMAGAGGKQAELMHPGHPLMQAMLDLMLERHRKTLKNGAVLLDPNDMGTEPRLLFMLEHRVLDESARVEAPVDVSRELHFVTLAPDGTPTVAGPGPHLDLVSLDAADRDLVLPHLPSAWHNDQVERTALAYAAGALAQPHFERVAKRRTDWVDRTRLAVQDRLLGELKYWDHRHERLHDDYKAGKGILPNVQKAKEHVDEITSRLNRRLAELEAMRFVRNGMPSLVGAAVVVPQGLIAQLNGETPESPSLAIERARVERLAMEAVIAHEQALGHEVEDVSALKCGWDVTSRDTFGRERHIEVKGRHCDATTITVTRNEILYGLNQAEKFILAVVRVDGVTVDGPHYIREPFSQAPDWAEASRNFDLNALLARAEKRERMPT